LRISPQVTAIVTTHRRPERLRQALLSLREETYPDLDCVVIDDGGSLDASVLHDVLPSARLARGHSLGVAKARNLGLAAARGAFVIFLDDDDVALPSRVATLVAEADAHGADLCYGLTRRVAEGHEGVALHVPTHPRSDANIGFCDLLTCTPHINAVLARTEAVRGVGGFDEGADHFDDWSAWLRLADRQARIRFVATVVSEWRLHDEGLTGAVHRKNAMSQRLAALFDRLIPQLTEDSASALAVARDVVHEHRIETYDDYATLMSGIAAQSGLSSRTNIQSTITTPIAPTDIRRTAYHGPTSVVA
jgi:glycosyltransferase involved in cell wall biosynthesis